MKEVRYCKVCGKQLVGKQKVYCSHKCCGKDFSTNNRKPVVKNCKDCGKTFESLKNGTKYCKKCSEKKRTVKTKTEIENDYNRPYTAETAYYIQLWHYKLGDSVEEIAHVLRRSVENVKLALKEG